MIEISSLLLKNVDNFSIGVPAAIEISKGLFSIINSLVSFNIFSSLSEIHFIAIITYHPLTHIDH